MPKTSTTRAAVALLQDALAAGHTVKISLAAPPHVDCTPPLVTTCRLRLGLTEAEARVLAELLEHGYAAKENLLATMSPHGATVPKINSLAVIMCKVRQKLNPHGVTIETLSNQGYCLTESARDRLRQLLADRDVGADRNQPKSNSSSRG